MATYKVIQDIEAEDKLLGPLSLRQFIYAVIVVVLGFVMFQLFRVNFLLPLPLLPFAILFGILAAPFGHDQSSEIWLLAKIRFLLKPRIRKWDQSGLQELVKITVPKKVELSRTDGLDETQVKSRLSALAHTLDTRGWALKGVEMSTANTPYAAYTANTGGSDRLLMPSVVPAQGIADDVSSADDILDAQHNPVAQHMSQMVQANDQARRQALMAKMDEIRNTQAQAPVAQPQPAPVVVQPPTQPVAPAAQQSQPQPTTPLQQTPQPNAVNTVPEPPNPAILGLASNDDLSVATIARQANKATDGDEVVISLR